MPPEQQTDTRPSSAVAPARSASPAPWLLAGALSGALPALGAAFAAWQIMRFFSQMAQENFGGIGTIAQGLYEANRYLLASLGLAVLLAGAVAVVSFLRRSPSSLPGIPLVLLTVFLSGLPFLLLWVMETTTLRVIAPGYEGSVPDASQRLSLLLVGTLGSGGLAALVLALFTIFFLVRSRPRPYSIAPALGWGGAAVFFLVLTVLLYQRSAYLQHAALIGQL